MLVGCSGLVSLLPNPPNPLALSPPSNTLSSPSKTLSSSSSSSPSSSSLPELAKVASKHGVGHLVNFAYGVQCAATCKLLSKASRVGVVDGFVFRYDVLFALNCSP